MPLQRPELVHLPSEMSRIDGLLGLEDEARRRSEEGYSPTAEYRGYFLRSPKRTYSSLGKGLEFLLEVIYFEHRVCQPIVERWGSSVS